MRRSSFKMQRNSGMLEYWPPARKAYASERMMGSKDDIDLKKCPCFAPIFHPSIIPAFQLIKGTKR